MSRPRLPSRLHLVKGTDRPDRQHGNEIDPPLLNDLKVTQWVEKICKEALLPSSLGADSIVPQRTMGGEDMSYFLREVPGCYFFVGSGNPQGCDYAHHHPRFNVDEDALLIGVELFMRLVEQAPQHITGS